MTKEQEEAVKKLKDITPDDLLNCWEGGEEEYNAIQTVLRYIDNSISKDKIKEILKDLNSEYIKTEKDFDAIYKKRK